MLCIFSCIYAVVDLCTCSFLLEELYYSFTLEFTYVVFLMCFVTMLTVTLFKKARARVYQCTGSKNNIKVQNYGSDDLLFFSFMLLPSGISINKHFGMYAHDWGDCITRSQPSRHLHVMLSFARCIVIVFLSYFPL